MLKKIMLILVLVLFASTCFAEKYQFQESAENEDAPKIPICKDFMANLKALDEPPMVCDRKFHPKFKQFTWPKWKKLDAWENRDLIFQIWEERFSYGRGRETMMVILPTRRLRSLHLSIENDTSSKMWIAAI